MNRRALFLLALVPQLLFVGALVVQGERTLALGRHVVLRAEAHVATDPLRGRFLELNFDVARIDASLGPAQLAPDHVGRTIYVGLWEQGDASTVFEYAFAPIDLDGAVLQGTLREDADSELRVTYGFEQFFIAGDGPQPSSDALRSLTALVRVDAAGHGIVEDVLIDGVPYARWVESR